MSRFKEGEKVFGIYFQDDSWIDITQKHCDKITVVMENGQMAPTPWFAVWKGGKIISKWNGAFIVTVKPIV